MQKLIRTYHALGSHQFAGGGSVTSPGRGGFLSGATAPAQNAGVIPPPMVKLIILGYVNVVGFMEDVRTRIEPPWGLRETQGPPDVGQISAPGASISAGSCTFTGKFYMMPGMQSDGRIVVTSNNNSLSSGEVQKNLYQISA